MQLHPLNNFEKLESEAPPVQGKATHPNQNSWHKQFAHTLSAMAFLKREEGTVCTLVAAIRVIGVIL